MERRGWGKDCIKKRKLDCALMMHNYVVGRKCIEGFFLSFFLNQEMIRCEICILKGFKDDFTIKKITYDYDY